MVVLNTLCAYYLNSRDLLQPVNMKRVEIILFLRRFGGAVASVLSAREDKNTSYRPCIMLKYTTSYILMSTFHGSQRISD